MFRRRERTVGVDLSPELLALSSATFPLTAILFSKLGSGALIPGTSPISWILRLSLSTGGGALGSPLHPEPGSAEDTGKSQRHPALSASAVEVSMSAYTKATKPRNEFPAGRFL